MYYFFLAAFLTAGFVATGLAEALAGAGFGATALFADLVATLAAVVFGAVFLASTGFWVAGVAVLAAFFLTDFWVANGPSLAAFLEALPPKIPFQPSEYFSFVPTRVIVTESPFNPNGRHLSNKRSKAYVRKRRLLKISIHQVSGSLIVRSIRFSHSAHVRDRFDASFFHIDLSL